MKATLKPLAIASAVAAVTAGYSGVTQAQATLANNSLGDLGIIPYYTVADNFVTGVHIINTDSANTQVVKLRLRRASDSMDALDFNIILSPNDEWTGFIDDASGNVVFATDDNSAAAAEWPRRNAGPVPRRCNRRLYRSDRYGFCSFNPAYGCRCSPRCGRCSVELSGG